ncbi:GntR family transcriptional regulator [Sediminispirochaeta smaragdinae]|jgi:DNA-binding transcriptional regulator YhcF (GntR family)|uniref:Transcriptional regulator, GntR family n=1 Tax=Sediminispirochaeta smaragdinae (strain DSM 11293 / JCM 15392 / SEBR 4228) TaxID=573413 RepID=E1R5D3_SEDSS|nr:GntR family transcriptional regulator [Sediminispirochaeta smaragdinae]ADK82261.1 transcriptional regulator, GntR family [Sediminispirochaeta smaragdinae DSM 11293]
MEFDDTRPIYLQIADFMFEQIITGTWPVETRVPSIRELAGMMQVNPNTAMRTYSYLQELGVIYNKRGIGYFVAPEGAKRVKRERKKSFFEEELPALFHAMETLDITIDEVIKAYKTCRKERKKE